MHHFPEPFQLVPAPPVRGICLQLSSSDIYQPLPIPMCQWLSTSTLPCNGEGGHSSLGRLPWFVVATYHGGRPGQLSSAPPRDFKGPTTVPAYQLLSTMWVRKSGFPYASAGRLLKAGFQVRGPQFKAQFKLSAYIALGTKEAFNPGGPISLSRNKNKFFHSG